MIQVFCVLLVGEPILLDGQPLGFYRNEYVAALTEERAIDVAKEKVMNRLKRNATEFIEGKPFALNVESVKPGMPPWRLFRNEGFLFFPTEEPDVQ
jgi:hypothetical protein